METKTILNKLFENINLNYDEAVAVMKKIMNAQYLPEQTSAILTALRMKGETPEEIFAFSNVLTEFAEKTNFENNNKTVIDTCGTGGDKCNTFNISTAVAFILSAAGAYVAKHGNRSVSSKSGSADVLEKLNININISKNHAGNFLNENNFVFLFAQKYHKSMKNVGLIRKNLGVRTVFNLLGPLCNPIKINHQFLGIFDKKFMQTVANVLLKKNLKKAIVCHGNDGLDEVSISDSTTIIEIENKKIKQYEIEPEQFGLKKYNISELAGGDASENANIILDLFNGKIKGAKYDFVILNSAVALYTANLVKNIEEGLKLSQELISSGKVIKKINQIKINSNKF